MKISKQKDRRRKAPCPACGDAETGRNFFAPQGMPGHIHTSHALYADEIMRAWKAGERWMHPLKRNESLAPHVTDNDAVQVFAAPSPNGSFDLPPEIALRVVAVREAEDELRLRREELAAALNAAAEGLRK